MLALSLAAMLLISKGRLDLYGLIPAVLIHMLINIGGTLPLWISQWLHTGM